MDSHHPKTICEVMIEMQEITRIIENQLDTNLKTVFTGFGCFHFQNLKWCNAVTLAVGDDFGFFDNPWTHDRIIEIENMCIEAHDYNTRSPWFKHNMELFLIEHLPSYGVAVFMGCEQLHKRHGRIVAKGRLLEKKLNRLDTEANFMRIARENVDRMTK